MASARRTFRVTGPQAAGPALELLAAEGYEYEQEPFWNGAYALTREPRPLGSSLAAAFGLIYIQDRSSMLPPLMLNPHPGADVLDFCASPGGKTGIAAMLAGRGGFVLANEPQPRRLATLRRNLAAADAANIGSCGYPGEDLPLQSGAWRNLLLDPPCSGWGTEEKHPRVKTLWTGDKIEPLVKLQRRLLTRAAGLLAPGGRLMYSTCTTNPDENEAQVRFAREELGLELVPLSPPPGISLDEPADPVASGCMRVTGGENSGQGFFLALFTRSGTSEAAADGFEENEMPGREPTNAELESMSYCDLSSLPPGQIRVFSETAHLVHEHAPALLPPGFKWRAYALGRFKKSRFHVEPRARRLCPVNGETVDVDDAGGLTRLISGQGLKIDKKTGYAGLAFRGAPLGWLTVKNGRALWTPRD
jgi:16S rRNA (cytosine1407-C5)-methyltransferase